jgi:hypothetical protein
MCERATATSAIAAVDVLAVLKKKGEADKLVIEIQYRFVNRFVTKVSGPQ